jgi:hypothetical protein
VSMPWREIAVHVVGALSCLTVIATTVGVAYPALKERTP